MFTGGRTRRQKMKRQTGQQAFIPAPLLQCQYVPIPYPITSSQFSHNAPLSTNYFNDSPLSQVTFSNTASPFAYPAPSFPLLSPHFRYGY